jgi:hypothetical protein
MRTAKRAILMTLILAGSVWGVSALSARTQTRNPNPTEKTPACLACFSRIPLTKTDRLQIWKDVMFASESSRETNAVILHDTGRDQYDSLYLEALEPTLNRYGLDRTEAFLVFEEEGGWPFPLVR